MTDPRTRTAWAWVEHLRAGGATPWRGWAAAPDDPSAAPAAPAAPAVPAAWSELPGAAQLELVRRLAARRADVAPALDAAAFRALADRALGRPRPGRGLPPLPLAWPADPAPAGTVGPPPTDPGAVPAAELVRVGTGLLADLLLDLPPAPARDGGGSRLARWRPRARTVRVAGAPLAAAAVRADLRAAGHRVLPGPRPGRGGPPAGRREVVLLVAAPLDRLLAEVWSARLQEGGTARWEALVRRWARRDRLPWRADLAGLARAAAATVGPERVHVLATADPGAVAAGVLGHRPVAAPAPDGPVDLSPAALELLRRVNQVLELHEPPDLRPGRLRRLVPLLPAAAPAADPPAVPPGAWPWLEARARAMTDALRAGGYPVHGDPGWIAPRRRGRPGTRLPDQGAVADLVLDTVLRLADPRAAGEATTP